ncbi:cytochrome P450 [Amycolatopsis thermophila]|uniref:Cytochrome P450 n=1 Tax=Amycolatopsis thermophila TaxID=206084 RepID=A0ABU0F298_9PSEU|nr:cytochrome P450 [Amycolatopsis thermophila]MDQ0381708.1 cytochrome P450 [Amycolatopsis thermophila]
MSQASELSGHDRTDPVRERARTFDHLDPAVAGTVHEVLGEFRRECPVAHSEAHGGMFVVTRFDDLKHVAEHGEVFSSAAEVGAVVVAPETGAVIAPLFEQDLAEHAAWRRHLQPFFTPRAAATHTDYVRRVAREVVAELAPLGEADLVPALCARIPPLVIASLMGIPEPERPVLASLVHRLAGAGSEQEAAAVGQEYTEFLLAQIRSRRGKDGDDVLTSVVNSEIGGKLAGDYELLKFAFLLVAAGNLTTTDQLASILLELAQDPALRARVVADPGLIPQLVEESVRHESAVAATGRTVVAETELAGVPLRPGDRMLLTWGSGNRDERYFPDGDEFRLGRPRKPHLGWGAGAHRCLGLHVARVELRVICEELLAAIPDFTLPPGFVPQRTYGVIRGVKALPVVWSADR